MKKFAPFSIPSLMVVALIACSDKPASKDALPGETDGRVSKAPGMKEREGAFAKFEGYWQETLSEAAGNAGNLPSVVRIQATGDVTWLFDSVTQTFSDEAGYSLIESDGKILLEREFKCPTGVTCEGDAKANLRQSIELVGTEKFVIHESAASFARVSEDVAIQSAETSKKTLQGH